MAGENGQVSRNVVSRERFEQTLERRYEAARKKLFAKAEDLLRHEKVFQSVAGICNTVLAEALQKGIEGALGSGSPIVKVEVNTASTGKRLWKHWPPRLRNSVEDSVVVLAVELLLSQAGFEVSLEKHMMVLEVDLAAEDQEEVEIVEPEEGLDSAADDLAPALTDSESHPFDGDEAAPA